MKPTRDERHRATLGNRLRFAARVIGLLALLAVPTGLLLTHGVLPSYDAGIEAAKDGWPPVLRGESGVAPQVGAVAIVAGVVLLALWLAVEFVGAAFLVTGKRTAIGLNTVVQVAAAAVLLVAVNALSFTNYWRQDATRDRRFTLAPELVAELKRLRAESPTTIVVLRQGAQANLLAGAPDAYDDAAQNKVVEKVGDLVAQLREFGPRFNVVVLDTKSTKFERQSADLTRRRPGLAAAIEGAPENSIFFYADEKVVAKPRAEADRLQGGTGPRPAVTADPDDAAKSLVYPGTIARMAFRDFYQLDKTASIAARGPEGSVEGQGNLVLLTRGPEAFVKRLLTLEARKPRVALAVIHPFLTSRETINDYSAAGLRLALERNGFDVTDIILKKWSRGGPPTPAATTFDESELDRSEARDKLINSGIANREALIREIARDTAAADALIRTADAAKATDDKRKTLTDAAKVVQGYVRTRIASDADLRSVVAQLKSQVEVFKAELAELQAQVGEASAKYRDLLRNERAVESRRVTDVKAKFQQYTADADVLIVPRVSVVDIVRGNVIPSSLFNVSKEQAEVVKEFLKAGKPVLFALGPVVTEPRGPAEGADDVEKLLPQFGVIPGRQTILTDEEATAIAERQGQEFGVAEKLTPLNFDHADAAGKLPNPVAAAFRTTARAVDKKLDLKRGGYRPIYLAPGVAERSRFTPEIMFTGANSFNEENPVPADDAPPKYEPTRPDDPRRGTRDEERRGPFTVGVAVEAKVPADWFDKPDAKLSTVEVESAAALALPFDGGLTAALTHLANDAVARPTVRLVVLGHGGLFNGLVLDGAQETLLVDSLNWQLRRDDALPVAPSAETTWTFPRADLTPRQFFQWRWGTFVGLPAAIAVIGLIALMIRKVR